MNNSRKLLLQFIQKYSEDAVGFITNKSGWMPMNHPDLQWLLDHKYVRRGKYYTGRKSCYPTLIAVEPGTPGDRLYCPECGNHITWLSSRSLHKESCSVRYNLCWRN